MLEFKINDYLTLKLENGRSNIYINNKKFEFYCERLLLNIIKGDQIAKNIDSIDEMEDYLDDQLEEPDRMDFFISPEEEFQAHCSNIQAWAENDYDTRILHRNLAFPLLKRLYEEGDGVARKVFKDEVAQRIGMGNNKTILFLCVEGHLEVFNEEELNCLLDENNLNELRKYLISKPNDLNIYAISYLIKCSRKNINLENDLIKNKLLLPRFLKIIRAILKSKEDNSLFIKLITDIAPILLKMLTYKMKNEPTNIVVMNEALKIVRTFLRQFLTKEKRYLKEKNFHYLLEKYFEQKNFEIKIKLYDSDFSYVDRRNKSEIKIESKNLLSKKFYYDLITMNFPSGTAGVNCILLEILGEVFFKKGICVYSNYNKGKDIKLITLVYNDDFSNIITFKENLNLKIKNNPNICLSEIYEFYENYIEKNKFTVLEKCIMLSKLILFIYLNFFLRQALYVKQECLNEKSKVEYNANNYKARIRPLNESNNTFYIEIAPKGENYFYKYEIGAFYSKKFRYEKYKKRGVKKSVQMSLEKKNEINKIIKEILFPKEDMKIKETEIIDDVLRILIE